MSASPSTLPATVLQQFHHLVLPLFIADPAHWLAGKAGWLLGLGAAGGVAACLLPAPAAVRLARLRSVGTCRDAGSERGRGPGRPLLVHLRRLPARLGLLLGTVQARRRRVVVEMCRVLAAELRAGRDPGAAMESAVAELDPDSTRELAPLRAAAAGGQDVVPVLRTLATTRGACGLGHLAACWRVAAGTGAPPAEVVDRLAESLAGQEAQRRELSSQLAGPRATAVMLSLLPVLGLGMASVLGGSPLAFLFTTPAGLTCLAAGLLLDAAGLFWTHRMANRVLSESGAG